MSVPKIYLDGTEINFTIRDSYDLELNPVNGKRQWSMDIWAGPNHFKPEQYDQIMALLTSGTHTYIAEDGVSYTVKVSGNPRISGVLQGYPVISLTLAEPGFEDEEDSGDDVEITGTFAGHAFTAKLSDYSSMPAEFGESVRNVVGGILFSDHYGEFNVWAITLPWWAGADSLRRGQTYSFNFSYIDADGVAQSQGGTGILKDRSRSGNKVQLTLEGGTLL